MRALALLAALALAAPEDCSDYKVVRALEWWYKAQNVADLTQKLVDKEAAKCRAGECREIALDGCGSQSIDDLHCRLHVLDDTTDVNAEGALCHGACAVLDFATCKTADFVACKAGCVGISSCVEKCEAKIVKPCEERLTAKCHAACSTAAQLSVSIDLLALRGAVTGLEIDAEASRFECEHLGILAPLKVTGVSQQRLANVDLVLHLHAHNGLTIDKELHIEQLSADLAVPVEDASIGCGLMHDRHIHLAVGTPEIKALEFNLESRIVDGVVAALCVGIDACEHGLKGKIDELIAASVRKGVHSAIALHYEKALNRATDRIACPSPFHRAELVV